MWRKQRITTVCTMGNCRNKVTPRASGASGEFCDSCREKMKEELERQTRFIRSIVQELFVVRNGMTRGRVMNDLEKKAKEEGYKLAEEIVLTYCHLRVDEAGLPSVKYETSNIGEAITKALLSFNAERIAELEEKSRRFYNPDGSFEVFESEEVVIEKRIEFAKQLKEAQEELKAYKANDPQAMVLMLPALQKQLKEAQAENEKLKFNKDKTDEFATLLIERNKELEPHNLALIEALKPVKEEIGHDYHEDNWNPKAHITDDLTLTVEEARKVHEVLSTPPSAKLIKKQEAVESLAKWAKGIYQKCGEIPYGNYALTVKDYRELESAIEALEDIK